MVEARVLLLCAFMTLKRADSSQSGGKKLTNATSSFGGSTTKTHMNHGDLFFPEDEAPEVITMRSRTAASNDLGAKLDEPLRPVTEAGSTNRQRTEGVLWNDSMLMKSSKTKSTSSLAVTNSTQKKTTASNSIATTVKSSAVGLEKGNVGSPKSQRPRSRKLYLGSGKDLNSPNHDPKHKDSSDGSTPTRLARPQSRKLYLGSKSSQATAETDKADKKERKARPSSVRVETASETKRPAKSAGSGTDRPRLQRLSSFSGFSARGLGLDEDEEPKERPPSRQSSAFPVHLADTGSTRAGNRPKSGQSSTGNRPGSGLPVSTRLIGSGTTSTNSTPGNTDNSSNADATGGAAKEKWRHERGGSSSGEWKSGTAESEGGWRTPQYSTGGTAVEEEGPSKGGSRRCSNKEASHLLIAKPPGAAHPGTHMDRSNLPTRGLSDPVSDGFTLLEEEDNNDGIKHNWPFAIKVNYDSNDTKNAKFSNSAVDASPSSSTEIPRGGLEGVGEGKVDGRAHATRDYVTELLDDTQGVQRVPPRSPTPSPSKGPHQVCGARTPPQSHHGARISSLQVSAWVDMQRPFSQPAKLAASISMLLL